MDVLADRLAGALKAPGADAGKHLLEHDPGDFGTRCEICGASLTEAEISEAREGGRSFLCGLHAAELLPAEELSTEEDAAP